MMSGSDGINLVFGMVLGAITFALFVALINSVSPEDAVSEYKVNQCIMKMPPQVPDVLDRCTAAVWMEENK